MRLTMRSTLPAIESQSLETVGQVKAIIAGDVPLGAFNAYRRKRRRPD